MSAARVRAFARTEFGALWDGGIWSAMRPSEAAMFRMRKFIDDLSPFNPRRARGGGPGRLPEEDGKEHDNPWNDPALWMLMMH